MAQYLELDMVMNKISLVVDIKWRLSMCYLMPTQSTINDTNLLYYSFSSYVTK